MNTLLLDALKLQNTKRPPVWLMRQAGRYQPSYRKLRDQHSLETLFHNSDLATKVTLNAIAEFDFDAAIVFSDILILFEVLGLKVAYPESGGPFIENAPKTKEAISALPLLDVPSTLSYVGQTIINLKSTLQVPLIGFCGAPFTLACYLLDRPTSESMLETKALLYQHPEVLHALLEKITEASIHYLGMQIEAGVDVIQIFDSWATCLSSSEFRLFCLPYLKKLVDFCNSKKVPVILFARGSSLWYPEFASLNPAAISIDWHGDMSILKDKIPMAIQGNLDPALLLSPPEIVEEKAKILLEAMRGHPGYIFNLGHGILPKSRPESVQKLVQTVKNFF